MSLLDKVYGYISFTIYNLAEVLRLKIKGFRKFTIWFYAFLRLQFLEAGNKILTYAILCQIRKVGLANTFNILLIYTLFYAQVLIQHREKSIIWILNVQCEAAWHDSLIYLHCHTRPMSSNDACAENYGRSLLAKRWCILRNSEWIFAW